MDKIKKYHPPEPLIHRFVKFQRQKGLFFEPLKIYKFDEVQ